MKPSRIHPSAGVSPEPPRKNSPKNGDVQHSVPVKQLIRRRSTEHFIRHKLERKYAQDTTLLPREQQRVAQRRSLATEISRELDELKAHFRSPKSRKERFAFIDEDSDEENDTKESPHSEMHMDFIKRSLRGHYLLSSFQFEHLSHLAGAMRLESFKRGELLWQARQKDAKFHVLAKGTAKVAHVAEKKGNKILLLKGDRFGHLSMQSNAVKVTATGDCKVWTVSRSRFRKILKTSQFDKMKHIGIFLRTRKLFNSLTDTQIATAAEAFGLVEFKDKTLIIREGEADVDVFYILLAGTVRVSSDGKHIRDMSPGVVFGARSLILKGNRSASCMAVGVVECYAATRTHFEHVLEVPLKEAISGARKRIPQTKDNRANSGSKRPPAKQNSRTNSGSRQMPDRRDDSDTNSRGGHSNSRRDNSDNINNSNSRKHNSSRRVSHNNNNNSGGGSSSGSSGSRISHHHSSHNNNSSSSSSRRRGSESRVVQKKTSLRSFRTGGSMSGSGSGGERGFQGHGQGHGHGQFESPPSAGLLKRLSSSSSASSYSAPCIGLKPIKRSSLRRSSKVRHFDSVGIVGRGGFGLIVLTKHRSSGKPYVLKVCTATTTKAYTVATRERELLQCLDHPHIVTLHNSFERRGTQEIYLVLEFLQGGDLFNLLLEFGTFTPVMTRYYCATTYLALAHMHSRSIIFRDLKLENMALRVDGMLKLVDFGLAKHTADKCFTMCGSPEIISPEMINNTGYHTQIDFWALGVLVHEMAVGCAPFGDRNSFSAVHRNVINYSRRRNAMSHKVSEYEAITQLLPWLAKCKQGYTTASFVYRLLHPQPFLRLGCTSANKTDFEAHMFFQNPSWSWQKLNEGTMQPPYTPKVDAGKFDTQRFDKFTNEDAFAMMNHAMRREDECCNLQ